jgi:hypothetical protein
MELLVYVRNVRKHGAGPVRTYVGIAVGEAPRVEVMLEDAPTSYVEVRVRADAVDPATEIALLVAKALAIQGLPGGEAELEYEGMRGSVRLLPEPGFDSTREICRAILPVLQRCRVHRGTVTTARTTASVATA